MKDEGYSVCNLFGCSLGEGFMVPQLVEALCYEPEGHKFNS
jgi:hypothetical protein